MMNHLGIKSFLGRKHISVSDLWLSACLEFLKEEHQDNNRINNVSFLSEKVYEQWLHSNLIELGSCCLPLGLSQKSLFTINGHFPLQVNQIKDIGTPAYTQLQKIRKDDSSNAQISADKSNQPAWEPKACRMLMMELTDGKNVVKGIEYQPIPSLSQTMKPGCKILVSGSVEVRRGVLLLKSHNICILGGEVDDFFVPNAQENILCRTLGLDEKENPIEITSDLISNVSIQQSQTSQYYPSQVNLPSQSRPSFPSISQQASNSMRPSSSQQPSHHPQRPSSSQQLSHHPDLNSTRNRVPLPRPSPTDEFDDFDFLDPSIIDKALSEAEQKASVSNANSQNAFKVSKNAAVMHPARRSFSQTDDHTQSTFTAKRNRLSFPETSTNNPSFSRAANFPTGYYGDSNSTESDSFNFSNHNKVVSISSNDAKTVALDDNSLFDDDDDELFMQVANEVQKQNIPRSLPDANLGSSNLSIVSTSNNFTRVPKNIQDITSKPPFSYLCLLQPNPSSKVTLIVKAFVWTLTSRLLFDNGYYQLSAKINDGTKILEIDFHDKVIEKIIGLSAKELLEQKKKAASDASLRTSFMQRFLSCQQELISLSCLFELEISPERNLPVVTQLIQFSARHLEEFFKRVKGI